MCGFLCEKHNNSLVVLIYLNQKRTLFYQTVSVPSSGSKRQTLSLTRSLTTGQQSTLPSGNQDKKSSDDPEQSGIGQTFASIFPLIRVLQVQVTNNYRKYVLV
jgi:hypothetical protein